MTLIEMGVALVVVGLVLAGIVLWTISIFTQMHVTAAGQELQALVPGLRNAHANDKVTPSERLDLLNLGLSPDTFGNDFDGRPILLSPWKRRITVYSGAPMGWGGDEKNPEFTVWFEDIPPGECPALVNFVMAPSMRSLGLVSIFIAHEPPQGDRYCLATDTYCKAAVVPAAEEIKNSCNKDDADKVSVFLGYAAH